jgi:hypothetical protein
MRMDRCGAEPMPDRGGVPANASAVVLNVTATLHRWVLIGTRAQIRAVASTSTGVDAHA